MASSSPSVADSERAAAAGLDVAVRTFLGPEDVLAFPDPTYSLYPTLCEIQGAAFVTVDWRDGWLDQVDVTVERLVTQAVNHARSGAAVIAPSGMMDGTVGALRKGLDRAGFADVSVLSYAVKYASAFYGPFREAAQSTPAFGDRRQYQMDPANVREAVLEAALDEAEGADLLMVKPALAYLDIIRLLKDNFFLPIAAYNVSGEYSMIKAAAQRGWLDEETSVMEKLTSMKRAGASIIFSYHTPDALRWLKRLS